MRPSRLRRRRSTAPLKHLQPLLSPAPWMCLRRRRSTAPLKPVEVLRRDDQLAVFPSTTIDGPIEAQGRNCRRSDGNESPSTTIDGRIDSASSLEALAIEKPVAEGRFELPTKGL